MNYLSNSIVGNLLDKLRKLYINGTVIQKFLAFLKRWKILASFCFPEQIFYRKLSLGAPVFLKGILDRKPCGSRHCNTSADT